VQALERLFKLREALYEQEHAIGIQNYSEIERSVLEFVSNQKRATISDIIKHPYFSNISLSTINRVVSKLLSVNAIKSTQATEDKRKMYLSYSSGGLRTR
jgi:DNA-binding MarR family transcriptional regulator